MLMTRKAFFCVCSSPNLVQNQADNQNWSSAWLFRSSLISWSAFSTSAALWRRAGPEWHTFSLPAGREGAVRNAHPRLTARPTTTFLRAPEGGHAVALGDCPKVGKRVARLHQQQHQQQHTHQQVHARRHTTPLWRCRMQPCCAAHAACSDAQLKTTRHQGNPVAAVVRGHL